MMYAAISDVVGALRRGKDVRALDGCLAFGGPRMAALTVYRIRGNIDGVPVTGFADPIADLENLTTYDLTTGDYDFEARFFVAPSQEKHPPWVEFLEPAFGSIDTSANVTNSAVLVVKVKYYTDVFFALTFGFGRYLLKPNSYERNYGLRVALNSVYGTGTGAEQADPARVRGVDAKTVAANTLRTRRQADRRATFEAFGVDVQRDFLIRLTGRPIESDTWGSRITGADAVNVTRAIEVSELGELCREIERTYRRDDYKERFAWVDNVHAVRDADLIGELEDRLIEKLRNRDTDNLEVAPPELLEWDDVASFKSSIEQDAEDGEPDLEHYLSALEDQDKLSQLAIETLRTHKLLASDKNGGLIGNWSIFRCLSGELELNGSTYILSEGDFFEVAAHYIGELNTYVANLSESPKALPVSVGGMKEEDYNALAANSSSNYLLLDKRTVRVSKRTSQIEICDILTDDGCFIHVKRKLGSSSLSHLFAQGSVSAELFLMSQEYRRVVLDEIRGAEDDRANASGDAGFRGRFSTFDVSGISSSDYEIVYAVVARWGGRTLVEALPFFSKVNLRRHVDDLLMMGYKVSCTRVEVPVDD